jgi:hypothetical protein
MFIFGEITFRFSRIHIAVVPYWRSDDAPKTVLTTMSVVLVTNIDWPHRSVNGPSEFLEFAFLNEEGSHEGVPRPRTVSA